MKSFISRYVILVAISTTITSPTRANNFGESTAWQFLTPAERAVRIAQLELIEKRRAGYYAAPAYNTRIDRQYTCTIAATSTGNTGSQTSLANSPSLTGATASATGNENGSSVDASGAGISNSQANAGPVLAGVVGSTEARVQGVAWQALNSQQSNSGNQQATVTNSQACAFGALNG